MTCLECQQPNEVEARYCHYCGTPTASLRLDREMLAGWSLFPGEERVFSLNLQNEGGGLLDVGCQLQAGASWACLQTDALSLGPSQDNTVRVLARGTGLQPGRRYTAKLQVRCNGAAGSRRDSEREWDRWCSQVTEVPLELLVKSRGELVVNRTLRDLRDLAQVSERTFPSMFRLCNTGDEPLRLEFRCEQDFVRLPAPEIDLPGREMAPLPVTLVLRKLAVLQEHRAELVIHNRADQEVLHRLTCRFFLRPTVLELPVLGIDFGTSTCKVALLGDREIVQVPLGPEGSTLFPSNVYLGERGGLVIGEEASGYRGQPGYCPNLKSLLSQDSRTVHVAGRGEVDLHGLIKSYLRQLFQVARANPTFQHWVGDATEAEIRAVVTIPARTRDHREETMRAILGSLGFEELDVLVESTAASYRYAADDPSLVQGNLVLVFDCGAGTTDVSVLRVRLEHNADQGYWYRAFETLSEVGGPVGGNRFDARIYDLVVDRMSAEQRDRLRQALWEQESDTLEPGPAPEDLALDGSRGRSHLLLNELRRAKELGREEIICPGIIDFPPVRVSPSEVSAQVRPLVDELWGLCEEALDQAGELRPTDVARVYLVGGGSFLPAVEQMIRDRFGANASCQEDRVTSVARGAVASASTRVRQVLACDYVCLDPGRRTTLVSRGAICPTTGSKVLLLPNDPPFYVELSILQCAPGAQDVAVGTIAVQVDAPGGGRRLRIEYEVDELGDLDARVVYDPQGANLTFPMGVP
ncbi:MAG: Hsp70 family protein [Candidatus Eremiobacterota bacterium]